MEHRMELAEKKFAKKGFKLVKIQNDKDEQETMELDQRPKKKMRVEPAGPM